MLAVVLAIKTETAEPTFFANSALNAWKSALTLVE